MRVRLEGSRTEVNHTCKRIQMGLHKIIIQYKTGQLATYTQTKGVKCIGPDNSPCWKSSAVENVV